MTGTRTVHYAREGAVVTLTIDDERRRNVLSRQIRAGLFDGLRRAADDPDVAVVILTGAGDRAFCAGIDLTEMAQESIAVPPPDFLPIVRRTITFDKVLIAAVNGVAYGGGFLLAQMADLVVAAEHAGFAMPEAKVGRGAPWSVPLSRMIPRRVWMQLCLLGEPIGADRAHEIGFVNEVVPGHELMPAARRMAHTVIANAPLTVRASLEMARLTDELGVTAALSAADEVFEEVYLSRDAQEGPRAFRERRPPQWSGRCGPDRS